MRSGHRGDGIETWLLFCLICFIGLRTDPEEGSYDLSACIGEDSDDTSWLAILIKANGLYTLIFVCRTASVKAWVHHIVKFGAEAVVDAHACEIIVS